MDGRLDQTWDDSTETPIASPRASRSPTLVDAPIGLDAVVAEGEKQEWQSKEKQRHDNSHSPSHAHDHHSHLHLPHIPNPAKQHYEDAFPVDYETTNEIAREKEAARRAGEKGGKKDEEAQVAAARAGEAQVAAATDDDYPDGGSAWLVVAGGWCVSFVGWGYVNSFGVLLTWTTQHQLADYSSSSLAWIGAFQLFANMAFAILSGRLFDQGYCKHLLVAGLLVYTAGLFGLSYSSTYWQIFLSEGLACGIASGLMFLPACSAVAHHFKRRRMLALGALATGSSCGGVMYPSLINHLLHSTSLGFGWTFRIVGFINLALLSFACLTIKARLPPRKAGGSFVDFSVFKGDQPYALYVAAASMVWLGLYTPLFFSEEYALANGVSENIAFYSLSILNAASIIGRTVPNALADRFGVFNLLTPFTLASGILLFCWIPALKNTAGTIVFSLCFGLFQGAFVSLLPASVAALTTDMSTIGIRMSMAFLGQSVAALVGTPIAGYIIASGKNGYVGAGVFSGCTVLVGVAMLACVRMMLCRERGTPWV